MKRPLSFGFNWLDSGGDEHPEIMATFASLRIAVGDAVVTEVQRKRSHSTSDEIVVPLYPIAEWIAANWWPLLNEASGVGRKWFDRRHSLRSGGYGYCYPDLSFAREGTQSFLSWQPRDYSYANIRYLSGGEARVPADGLAQELADFVEAVCERLDTTGNSGTWMQSEWDAVQRSESQPEEREFCTAAGWLGLDPFELSEQDSEKVIAAATGLTPSVQEDALRAVTLEELQDLVDWIGAARQTNPRAVSRQGLAAGRAQVKLIEGFEHPWQAGYQLANDARKLWNLPITVPLDLRDLFGNDLPVKVLPDAPANVDGLAMMADAAILVTSKQRSESQRFLVARALSAYLTDGGQWSLLTAARTARQQVSRAFAAELLAPAQAISDSLPARGYLLPDDLVELAEKFEVSTYVVDHQVRNHRLAPIADSLSPGPAVAE